MSTNPQDTSLLKYSNLRITDSQVVLVYTEWNEAIIQELKTGAERILAQFPQVKIHTIQVPGAVEIPYVIQQFQKYKGADAYIALGCVIKGETPHFEYVCKALVEGVSQLNVTLDSPVIFGVLTVNKIAEAWDRLGGKHGHKGEEAAIAALKLISFKNNLKASS